MDANAIVERDATAQALSSNSIVLRAALDVVSDPIFLLDGDCSSGRALNAAGERLLLTRNQSASFSVAHVFPELHALPRPLVATEDATLQPHGLPTSIAAGADRYELHPVTLAAQQQIVLIVRTALESNAADDLSRRDALDDAFHDPLTRLGNRRLFESRLRRAIDRAERSQYHFAVLFVDLDRFKQVNDRFGHLQGDRVLVAAAHRLVEAVRPQDMVARRDGDEFTILLDDLERPDDAMQIAQRIVERLQAPLVDTTLDSTQITIGASIGIAMANNGRLSADELIARADSAMYHAKALGGGTYVNLDHSVSNPR